MNVTFNGIVQPLASIEDLGLALDRFDLERHFELWIALEDGPSLCMLRNNDRAWLMYLRFNGDDGFVTYGDRHSEGSGSYTLSNGQIDEYPLSWCIDVDECYKAIGYFFVNGGARYDHVTWQQA